METQEVIHQMGLINRTTINVGSTELHFYNIRPDPTVYETFEDLRNSVKEMNRWKQRLGIPDSLKPVIVVNPV